MEKSKLLIDYKSFYAFFRSLPLFYALFISVIGFIGGIISAVLSANILLFLAVFGASVLAAFIVFCFWALFISPIVVIADSAIEMNEKMRNSNPQSNDSKGNVTDKKADEPKKNKVTYVDIVCPHCEEKLSFPQEYIETHDIALCPLCDHTLRLK